MRLVNFSELSASDLLPLVPFCIYINIPIQNKSLLNTSFTYTTTTICANSKQNFQIVKNRPE